MTRPTPCPPDVPTTNNPDLRRLLALCGLERRFVRGRGVWLTSAEGRVFLDAYAQFGAVALGHNAPAVVQAVRAALDRELPAMVQPHPAENAEALGEALGRWVPGGPRRCVITTSGAEAVEAAIKLVRAARGRPLVLSAAGSFHGRTLGALSLTGQRRHQEGFGPLAPGFDTVPFGDAEALERRLARDERVAAFFVEPIQGEGGVNVPPPGYLARVREICSRHGVALVVDEIQTGLGRTGTMFAVEAEGVAPDVLLSAKALGGGLFPLGVCLVAEPWWSPRFALGHSSTFANNNVACGVGLAVLEALQKTPAGGGPTLPQRAAALGGLLGAGLRRLQERYPDLIRDVRGRGLLWGVELVGPRDRDGLLLGYLAHQGLYAYAVASAFAENASVLTLPALGAQHVLRLSPPLVIEEPEIARIVEGLEALCARLRRRRSETLLRGMGWLEVKEETADDAAPAPGVSLPEARTARRSRAPRRRRWAFLIHYTRPHDVRVTDPSLATLTDGEALAVCARARHLPPGIVLEAPLIRSPRGGEAVEGWLVGMPWLPAHMQSDRSRTREAIRAGVDLAFRLGADVVGLGGFTAPLSDRGQAVVGRGPAVTTGNALTAGMAVEALAREVLRHGRDLSRSRIGVVGARGSVGALAAALLARWRPARLVLVGNPASPLEPLQALASRIRWDGGAAESTAELRALAACDVVLSASGAARPVLAGVELAPGTIVCDVARPPDAPADLRTRADLVVVEGGLVRLPDPTLSFGPGNLQGLPAGVVLACLAETILHALDGTRGDTGVGDEVPIEQVDRVMAMARRHGFGFAVARASERVA